MENDRRDTFMNSEHEETGTRDLCEDSDNLGEDYFREEGGVRFLHVGARESPRDYNDEPRYLHDEDVYQPHVYEVRDRAGRYDEYPDEELVAVYASHDEAEEHAEQIGGYVHTVSEAPEVWSTRKDTMHADLMWDWENDDLFEGIAYLEERIENGELGREHIRGELFDLEDLVEEGKLDNTKDIRTRIMVLEYWYENRAFDLLGEH